MPTQPNNRQLFLPRKTEGPEADQVDKQTLEIWARQPIQQLTAGSGITLTPSSGLATNAKGEGPYPVEISASGGSSVLGHCTLESGPDFNEINSQAVFLGPTDQVNTYFSYLDVQSNSSGTAVANTMASSWIVAVLAAESICIFPTFVSPAFTGGPLTVLFQLQAWSIAETNVCIFTATHSFPSATTYQTQASDYTTVVNGGGDLSLVAGGSDTGHGVVSAAGGFYIVGVTVTINVPTGTTFT